MRQILLHLCAVIYYKCYSSTSCLTSSVQHLELQKKKRKDGNTLGDVNKQAGMKGEQLRGLGESSKREGRNGWLSSGGDMS